EKGMTLRVKDDGKVELTVKEDKAEKTYSAESADELERKYPEVVKKNGVGKYLRPQGGGAKNDVEKWFDDLRNRRLVPELPDLNNPFDEDFEKLLEELGKGMRKRFGDRVPQAPAPQAPPAPSPAPAGKEFGVKIDSVGDTLRDQLGLKEGDGVLVGE